MPTVIKLFPGINNQISLIKYLESNNIDLTRECFHSTLWYSISLLFQRKNIKEYVESKVPFTVMPPYEFDIFNRSLVLKYKSKIRDKLRENLESEMLRQTIKEFPNEMTDSELDMIRQSLLIVPENVASHDGSCKGIVLPSRKIVRLYFSTKPHITLVSNFDTSKIERLSEFDCPIRFDAFSWKLKYKK